MALAVIDRAEMGKAAEELRLTVEKYLGIVGLGWTEAVLVVENGDGREIAVRIKRTSQDEGIPLMGVVSER